MRFNSLRGYSMYLIPHNQSGPSWHILNTLLANIRAEDDQDEDEDDHLDDEDDHLDDEDDHLDDEDPHLDDSEELPTTCEIFDEDDPNDAFQRAFDDNVKSQERGD